MSRPLRIEYSGAWYHVMNRGAGRRHVFTTDAQRAAFLALAMYLCQEVGGLTLAQIAAQFGLSGYGGAGAVTRLVRQRLAADPALARTARQVARALEARE